MEPEFIFIGWCNENNHDKIWTSFKVGDNYYCAWGRRGKKPSFKLHTSMGSLNRLESEKRSKGYKEVDSFMLFMVFPDFKEVVEKELFVSLMCGKVK